MKVTYYAEPVVSPVGDGDEWVLAEDFSVMMDSESGDAPLVLTVPKGFTTDLASVPRIPIAFWAFEGKARRAAILHDWLYANKWPRDWSDLMFREAMKGEAPGPVRWIMWAAVRVGGGAYYP